MIRLLIALALFLSPTFVLAQNYEVSTMEVNNNNYSAFLDKELFIDSDGFLWYSTFNGIVKEMGNFNSFFFKYNTPKGTNIINTNALYETSKHKLIACTDGGFSILDLKTKESKWHSTTYPETNKTVFFTSAKEDSKGNIWLGTDTNYIYCYTNKGELIYTKILDSDYSKINISNLTTPKMEIIEILDDDSLIIQQNNRWYQIIDGLSYFIFDADDTFIDTFNSSTVLIPNGALFDLDTSGYYLFNNKKFYFKYLNGIDKQAIQLPYEKGQFIPNTLSKNFYNALNFICLDKEKLIGFKLEKLKENYQLLEIEEFPLKRKISNVLYDKHGYFWLQTEYGISKIRYSGLGFRKYLNQSDISCRGLTEDAQGNITLLTYSGLFKKEKGKDFFKEIETKNKTDYSFVYKQAYNFYKANDNNYWFYGFHDSLIHYNLKEDTFTYYDFPIQKISITDLLQTESSKFLLATSVGLYEFDLDNKLFVNVSKLNNAINLDKKQVRKLYETVDKSTLWISSYSEHALIKIDKITGEIDYFNKDSKRLPLVDNTVKVIYEDEQKNIWLGTENGLQKVNPKDYTYKNFVINSGLKNDNIAAILEDQANLWVSTFYGLVRLNKETETIQSYYTKDGLTHNEFNNKSALKDSNGNLYFGGLNGIISFSPEKIAKVNQENHKLFLTQYDIYDEDLKANKTVVTLNENTSQFTIPNRHNYLSLKFAINDILDSEKNTYQYRISSISKEWINLGNYSTLQLHGLNPGIYNLEVRGFSSNGNQTNILEYEVKIKQIFYRQFWFLGLITLIVFAFITHRNKKRRKYIKTSYEQKNKILQLEAKAMRAQMNPHFIFNTLNGMQSVMILKGEREANKYFTAFSRLLRITLDMSNTEYILLKNEIEYLKYYLELENLRLNNRIVIQFNIDPDLDIEHYSIPCMLFQPNIENALIHGLTPKKEDLKLTINFKKRGLFLVGEVIDNGIGRENAKKLKERKDNKHKSWASHIMNERIAISNTVMNEKINWEIIDMVDDDLETLGTKVILTIPLMDISITKKPNDFQ